MQSMTYGVRGGLWRTALLIALLTGWTLISHSAQAAPPKTANPVVVMDIAKRGKITIEMLPQAAPKTVAHFLDLVNKKFYDGILFHRYVADFVVQGGDPQSKKVKGSDIADIPSEEVSQRFGLGNGGSGTTVPLEATVPHERGTVGLARSMEENSGDSQFYFNLKYNAPLDNKYCVFGRITKGLDVMDKVRQGDKITSIRVMKASKKGRK